MAWIALLVVLTKLFNILSWHSFTLLCPLYASCQVIKSGSRSKNQQCLTFWVLFAIFTMLEQSLAQLFAWLPFWSYVKGVATVLLVIPYFCGASYVYGHVLRPWLSESLLWNILFLPWKKFYSLGGQNNFPTTADTNIVEDNQEESDKHIICQRTLEPNYGNKETEHAWPTSLQEVQREWSCALCLVITSSEKCLEDHLQGKKHTAMEEKLRADKPALKVAHDSSFMEKRNDGMDLLGNLNNFDKWSGLLSPIPRSIRWCTWKKPDVGWIKLNTDGSMIQGNAGFGGLLRDNKGDTICAFVSKAPRGNVFLVELWAIWRGLVLALGLGIKLVWVESDSMSVVKSINREQPYSGKADNCLKHIWQLLKKFKKYRVSHSWRETNRAADYLSRMALERSDVVLWPVDFPDSLCNIIRDDAQGKIYIRW